MRLPVGTRKQPGPHDIDPIFLFPIDQLPQFGPILRRDNPGRMVGKAGQDCDLMTSLNPVACQLRDPGGRCSHLRREVLRDVEDFHGSRAARWSREQEAGS